MTNPIPVQGLSEERTYTDLRSANIDRQAAWCPDQVPDLSFRGNELAGETGEVCNVIKKLERERLGWRGSRDTVEHLAEELADVVICADLCAISAGIDLNAAVVAKFNATSEKVGLPHRLSLVTELQHRREAEAGTPEEQVGQVARLIDGFAFEVDPPRKKDSEAKEYGRQVALATARRILAFLAASPSSPASGGRVKALDDNAERRSETFWSEQTTAAEAQRDKLKEALAQAQATLNILLSPAEFKNTSIMTAWALVVEAEVRARQALQDSKP